MVEATIDKIELAVLFLMMILTAAMAGFAFAAKTQESIMFTLGWMIFVGIVVANMLMFKIYREVKRR